MTATHRQDKDFLCLWAKLPREKGRHSYHPLICHLLDVSLLTRLIWTDVLSRWTRHRVSAALGLDEDTAGFWIAFFSGAHDIGKASAAFAFRRETPAVLVERMRAAGLLIPDRFDGVNHGAVSTYTLKDELRSLYDVPRDVATRVALAIGGHHGTFPTIGDLDKLSDPGSDLHGGPTWRAARSCLLRDLADLTGIGLPDQAVPRSIDAATAMWLAGFVSVADWIGSNDDFFHHAVSDVERPSHIDIADYRDKAQHIAHGALHRLGWLGKTSPSQAWSFGTLFPTIKEQAPMQREVIALVEENVGPALVVIEAPMGEGKTEAALYLADHWDALLGQHGFYVALPTQATSNQMYGRVRQFLEHRYAGDSRGDSDEAAKAAVLQLLHGHAALSGEFATLLRDGEKLFAPRDIYDDAQHRADEPDVVAGEWFTHKKRGLLSPFGVGTVDQALLAVLGTRHVFVRLFGLAGKTVVVDEIHAYDTYMSELLEQLLCWLGALGCSVVLLSATLPSVRRTRLVQEYRRGAAGTVESGATSNSRADGTAAYPRVTWVPAASNQPITMWQVETSARGRKVIQVERVDGRLPASKDDPFQLGDKLQRALADGGCAAVICNTVRRARQVYRALRRYFDGTATDDELELALLHARYPFEERDRREKRALIRFGKVGGTVETADGSRLICRPHRAVLVTTQIVEQSLDLDFDLMVTDLAPVDLVLQRTGRLWRHDRRTPNGKTNRPAGLAAPTLWLCEPETTNGRPNFGPSAYVYDAHVLLRSWYYLRPIVADGQLHVPDQVEDLVEAVYEEGAVECPADVASNWGRYWQETRRQYDAGADEDREEAKHRYIERPDYRDGKSRLDQIVGEAREEDSPESHPAMQALTRLTGLTVSIVLLRTVDGRPCLDSEGKHPVDLDHKPNVAEAVALLKQSLTLSGFGIVRRVLKCPVPLGWQKSALLRHYRAIVLDTTGRAPIGAYMLRLDPDEGVIVEKKANMDEIDEEAP